MTSTTTSASETLPVAVRHAPDDSAAGYAAPVPPSPFVYAPTPGAPDVNPLTAGAEPSLSAQIAFTDWANLLDVYRPSAHATLALLDTTDKNGVTISAASDIARGPGV